MTTPTDTFIDIGLTLHLRRWPGTKTPFVLVHGLASNALTWEEMAGHLARAGHPVVTVDQRGHGLSDKPADGYDFATITRDLAQLIDALHFADPPIVAGQSWGGNVVMEFGVRYPDVARGLAFVDGGFLNLRGRPNATWEQISEELKPPALAGMPRAQIKTYLQQSHPDWSDMGIEGTLGNFETRPDGTIRPWLDWERHQQILWAMWEQHPLDLFPQVRPPVLICPALDESNPEWTASKKAQVAAAVERIPVVDVHWFKNTDHDIHIQRPAALAHLFLDTLQTGIWSR